MSRHVLNELLHMDETTIQCNKEDGKNASTRKADIPKNRNTE